MAELNKLQLVIGGDASGLLAAVNSSVAASKKMQSDTAAHMAGIESAVRNMSNMVTGALKLVAGAFAIHGVVEFGKSVVMAASDASESLNKAQVVFGQSSATIEAFARDAAANLGLSRGAALEAAGTFGNLFVSMGIGQSAAADMSTGVLTLASDLASFNNIKPEEALEKLRAGLVGETEPLRTLGVNLNAAEVKARAMAMGFREVNGELPAAAKAQAAYSLILEQTKTAQGDFKNTSTGMANSMRIISASFEDAKSALGEQLLPLVAPLVSGFAQMLPRALESTRTVLEAVGGTIRALVTGQGFDQLYAGFVKTFGPDTAALIAAIVDPLARARLAFSQIAGGDVTGGLSALQSAVRQAFESVGRILDSLVQWVGDTAPALKARIMDWAQTFVTWVAPMIPPLLTELGQMAASAFDWIVSQVGPLIDRLGEWGVQLAAWVAPMIPPLLTELYRLLTGVLDWIVASAPPLVEKFLAEWVPAAIGWIARVAVEFNSELPSILAVMGKWVVENAPKVLVLFLELGAAIVRGIIRGLANVTGELFSAIGDLLARTFGHGQTAIQAHSPSRLFMQLGESMVEGMAEGVAGTGDSLMTAIETVAADAWNRADAISTTRMAATAAKLAQATSAQFNDILRSESANSQIAGNLQNQQAGMQFGRSQLENVGFDSSGLVNVAAINQAILALQRTGNTSSFQAAQNDQLMRNVAVRVRDFMAEFAPGDVPDLSTGKKAQYVLDEMLFPIAQGGIDVLSRLVQLGVTPQNGYTFLGKSLSAIQDMMFLNGMTSRIPGFATGGMVPGPLGAPLLAVVHGGEQVIPAGNGHGVNVTVNVYNPRSEIEFRRQVTEAVRDAYRDGGLNFLGRGA